MTHPNVVVFQPSLDHDAHDGRGRLLVDHYELEIYRPDTDRPVAVVNLGKPTRDEDGLVRVVVEDDINVHRLAGEVLDARVTAVGPSGVSRSGRSNTFVADGCHISAPGAIAVPPAGGPIEAAIVSRGCGAASGASADRHRDDASTTRLQLDAAANRSGHVAVGGVRVGPRFILLLQPPEP